MTACLELGLLSQETGSTNMNKNLYRFSILGASMVGACVGFLLHNRYRASVFMGDTGSLALGGALAVMAACTGMFFPLFVSSGIFIVQASSIIMQVSYFKTTKRLLGADYLEWHPFIITWNYVDSKSR